MYIKLKADKDAYITNRIIKNVRKTSSNVGEAGTLDLFKLYGYTTSGSTPNVELSRILLHYDLTRLRTLHTARKIDISSPSFNVKLKLFDVYGGQPTPKQFTVAVHPLSHSFDEGQGRDVAQYSDRDVCNFLTGSALGGLWSSEGCNYGGGLPGGVDYVTASVNVLAGTSLAQTQLFATGEEDLDVDVTLIVSATIAGLLPDEGYRIAFSTTNEGDTHSYFVKRFASRHAHDESKHPQLIVRFDDSIQDDSTQLTVDSTGYIFLYNYNMGRLAHITSGSSLTNITGSNSLILKMVTEISGGTHTLQFSGSQHALGTYPVTGVYSASINIPSTNAVVAAKLIQSGSVKFTPIWSSLDGTVGYHTGSTIVVSAPNRGGTMIDNKSYTVSVHNVLSSYATDVTAMMRVHIVDRSALPTSSKLPIELPGLVVRDVHYQVRDAVTNNIEVPFDTTYNSTRVSSDSSGMYFKLDANSLTPERTYVIDVLVALGDSQYVFKQASPAFRISNK